MHPPFDDSTLQDIELRTMAEVVPAASDVEARLQRARIAAGIVGEHGRPGQARRVGRDGEGVRGRMGWWSLAVIAFIPLIGWEIVRSNHQAPYHQSVVALRTYSTMPGQRASVTLPDGTRLALAPRTTVRILAFDGHTRILTLDGEAYFQVLPARRRPFVVRTGGVSTQVLGTAFEILHYPHDSGVRVAVAEGKVLVQGRDAMRATVTAIAGTIVQATDSTAVTTRVTDVGAYTSWTNGTLVFRGTTVRDMLVTVGRWYGYEFRLTDSTLAHRHVDFEVDCNSAVGTLKEIQQLLGVRMSFNGPVVTLYRNGGSPHSAPLPRMSAPVSPSIREYGR